MTGRGPEAQEKRKTMVAYDATSHKPLRELVYEQLKQQILEGQILPGTRMMEIALADEMGVSRTPVREAIRKLEQDGLVVIKPRKGACASDISIEEIADTMNVREHLEGFAAALAAMRCTDEEIDKLEEIVEDNQRAVDNADAEALIVGDEAFHNEVVRMSRNKTLLQLPEIVQGLIVRFRHMYYRNPALYQVMPDDHRNIVQAIRQRDPDKARKYAQIHVTKLHDFLTREGKEKLKYKR